MRKEVGSREREGREGGGREGLRDRILLPVLLGQSVHEGPEQELGGRHEAGQEEEEDLGGEQGVGQHLPKHRRERLGRRKEEEREGRGAEK